MKRGALAVIVSMLTIVAVGAGCGGSDEEALTKAEFIKQGNAICKQGSKEAAEKYGAWIKRTSEAEDGSAEADPSEAGEQVILPFYRSQVEELGALAPPSADEEKVSEIIGALEEGIEEVEENPEIVSETIPAISRSSKLAVAYGLEACNRY